VTVVQTTNQLAATAGDNGATVPGVRSEPEAELPQRAKPFLFGVIGLAGLLSIASLIVLDPGSAPWLAFAGLASAGAAAQLFVVRTGRNQSYHTAIPFLIAAALTLPAGLVVLVVVVQHVPDWAKARYPWYIQSFNIANYVLSALALQGAADLVGGVGESEAMSMAAIAAGVAVFVFTNHALLAAMLKLARGRGIRESGLFGREALAIDVILAGLGPVLVALWYVDPLLAVAGAAPLLLVQRAFSVPILVEDRERERRLRLAEMRYRLLVEQLPLATYILASDHNVRFVSPQLEAILGCTIEQALDEDEFWTERLHPDERERIPAEWRACVAEGRPFRAEYRMLAADGRTVWIQDEAVAAREGDTTIYFQGYLLDITERKEAEERLAGLLRQNELLLRSVGEGIFGLDRQGRLTFANPAAGHLTGCPPDRLIGLDLHRTIAHRDPEGLPCTGARCPFTETLEDGLEHHFEAEVTRLRNGVTYVADCTTTPLVVAGELVGAAIVLRDISEQRALEQQLRQAQKLEAVGKLAGGIAHDFNNLLTAISGHSELALAGLEGSPVAEHVSEIKRAAARAGSLTQQLLAFSRKQVLLPRVLNLNVVVTEVESLLQRLIGEDIALERELESALSPVRADPGQLEQVLVNLAVNARDAMPTGGRMTIRTANVGLSAEGARPLGLQAGRYVELAVRDTGHGMDASTCARVFEPFFTTKDQGKGTGLGLATAHGIVAQSGGSISVASTPGVGSVFTVYLPATEDAFESLIPAAEPSLHRDVAAAPDPSGTVLLVEDEDMVRELTRALLERAGVAVLIASDPHKALAVCREYRGWIDILLTDVVMPGMSGHALAEQARVLRPELEVIYTSGYSDDVVSARGSLEPGTSFLAKPFTSQELLTAIRAALEKKERYAWT
jgi:two-component system cell cycle sensor histidine kinase/response regulator CckA